MCPSAARSVGAVAKSTVSALALKCGQLWPPTVTLAMVFPVTNAGPGHECRRAVPRMVPL